MSRNPKEIDYKQYCNIEELITNFKRHIIEPGADRMELLIHDAYQVGRFNDTLMYEPDQLAQVIETVKLLRASSGPGVIIAEQDSMERLWYLTACCGNVLRINQAKKRHAIEDYEVACRANLDQLVAFARDCFLFKRPHDSFGGKRRARAFFILGATTAFFDLPDILELAQQTLKAKRSRSEASGASEFIELYYRNNIDGKATVKKEGP